MQECFHSTYYHHHICEWLNMLKKPNRTLQKGSILQPGEHFSSRFCVTLLLLFLLFFLFFVLHWKKKKIVWKPIILAMSYSCVLFRGPFFSLFPYDIRAQRAKIREKKDGKVRRLWILNLCLYFLRLNSRTLIPYPGCHWRHHYPRYIIFFFFLLLCSACWRKCFTS